MSASHGSEILYQGYAEISIPVLNHTFHILGFLVVRDPTNTPMEARKFESAWFIRIDQESMEDMYGDNYMEKVNRLVMVGHGLSCSLHPLKIYQTVLDLHTM